MRILKLKLKKCLGKDCYKEIEELPKDLDGHCCERMCAALRMCDVGIDYNKPLRMYDISIPARAFPKRGSRYVIPIGVALNYCPWCGTKLPADLTDKWEEILKKEYSLDNPWSSKQEKLVPVEFQTDEWWKKRGL